MADFLLYLAVFLVPIFLILLVNLQKRKKRRYPHLLLLNLEGQSIMQRLFKKLQLYFDVITDVLLALVLSLFFSGLIGQVRGGSIVCIDASYSMLIGLPGQRGIDEGAEKIIRLAGEQRKRYRLFVLGFNEAAGTGELKKIGNIKGGTVRLTTSEGTARFNGESNALELAAALQKTTRFFNRDISRLGNLRSEISPPMFLTDDPQSIPAFVRTVHLGREKIPQPPRLYPAADIRCCGGSGNLSRVRFFLPYADVNSAPPRIVVSAWDEAENTFVPLLQDKYNFEWNGDFVDILLESADQPSPGTADQVFAVSAAGLTYPVVLHNPELPVRTEGPVAASIAAALPGLLPGTSGSEGNGAIAIRETTGGEAFTGRADTLWIVRTDEPAYDSFLQPLRESFSRPVSAAIDPGQLDPRRGSADTRERNAVSGAFPFILYTGPAGLRNKYLPLSVMSYLDSLRPPPYRNFLHRPGDLVWDSEESLLYRRESGKATVYSALILGTGELFPGSPAIEQDTAVFQTAGETARPSIVLFSILLLLYLGKMAALFYLRGGLS